MHRILLNTYTKNSAKLSTKTKYNVICIISYILIFKKHYHYKMNQGFYIQIPIHIKSSN